MGIKIEERNLQTYYRTSFINTMITNKNCNKFKEFIPDIALEIMKKYPQEKWDYLLIKYLSGLEVV